MTTPPILMCCRECGEDRIPSAFRAYTDTLKDGTVVERRRRVCVWCERAAARERAYRRLRAEGRRMVAESARRRVAPPPPPRRLVTRLPDGEGWGDLAVKDIMEARIRMRHGL